MKEDIPVDYRDLGMYSGKPTKIPADPYGDLPDPAKPDVPPGNADQDHPPSESAAFGPLEIPGATKLAVEDASGEIVVLPPIAWSGEPKPTHLPPDKRSIQWKRGPI
jgi:hypothetical protein